MITWKLGRWICLLIALASALLLTGIADSILGINLAYKLLGFEAGLLLGIANLVSVWILYKVL